MRLNDGLPVWHVSVSASRPLPGSRIPRMAMVPTTVLEDEAVTQARGVGGPFEWWHFNRTARVGHLRVPLTTEEAALMPEGCAIHDAGEAGPRRPRTP